MDMGIWHLRLSQLQPGERADAASSAWISFRSGITRQDVAFGFDIGGLFMEFSGGGNRRNGL